MKKILSFLLLGLLCSIGNVWGVSPDVNISNFINDTTAYLKSYTSGTQTIALHNNTTSKMGFQVESNETAYYFKMESSQGSAVGPAGLKISASDVIDSVSILITANSANKACNVGLIGWEAGETTFSNIVTDFAAVFPEVTATSKKIADAQWTTLDLSSQSLTTIVIAKQFKSVVVKGAAKADFPSSGAQSFFLYGVKVWLHSTGGGSDPQPSNPVDPTITFNAGAYTVGNAALDLSTLFTSNSKGAVTFSVKTDGGTGAAINGTSFTATAAGTAVVTASQAAVSGTYNAKSVETNIVVSAATTPDPEPAGNVIFQWEKQGSTNIEADNTDLSNSNYGTLAIGTSVMGRMLGTNTIAHNNAGYKLGNNDVCIEIQGTSDFEVGDIVTIEGVCGGSGERSFAIAPVTTVDAIVDTALTNTHADKANRLEYVVSVKAAQAGAKMRIFRLAGKTMYLQSIKVTRPAPSSDPVISAANASIVATESGVEATQNIAVTGANLTGSTLTATLNPAVAGLSVTLDASTIAEGAISTNAVLHYVATENVAEGQTTLTLSDGTTSKDVTITYSALVSAYTLQSVSEAIKWDFSTLSGGIQYSDDDLNVERVYANIAEITCPASFDGTALAFTGEYPLRSGKGIAQNGTLRFNTTVPGVVVVKFSDTGTSASDKAVKRYLVVNGETTEYWASRENNSTEAPYAAQLNVLSGPISVPAGDVTISGSSALVYQTLEFIPEGNQVQFNLGTNGWSTYSDVTNFTASGATIYKAAFNGTVVTLTEVPAATVIKAGEGIILKGDQGDQVTITRTATTAAALADNDLLGSGIGVSKAPEHTYVIATQQDEGEDAATTKFYPYKKDNAIPANKAYMIFTPAQQGAPIRIVFAEETTTDINSLEASEKAQKFFENGNLYILREGVVYDATGRVVR